MPDQEARTSTEDAQLLKVKTCSHVITRELELQVNIALCI